MGTEGMDDVARKLYRRPDLFVKHCLGGHLWSKQVEIARSVATHKKTAVAACNGPGKSDVAAKLVLWWTFCRAPSMCITTAPTWSQVETILWSYIGREYYKLPEEMQAVSTLLNTRINIAPDHFAYGLSTDKPGKLQGRHHPHLLVVVDEANEVPDSIMSVIGTLGSGGEYRELLIGNPVTSSGKFYNAFRNPELGYNTITIDAFDTPNFTDEDCPEAVKANLVTPASVAEWAAEWGEASPMYQSRVHAIFPDGDEDNVLCPLSWLLAAKRRALDTESYLPLTGTAQCGLDVARFGTDKTSFAGSVGHVLCEMDTLDGRTGTLDVVGWAAGKVRAYAAKHGTVTLLVDEGYNPGVYDLLRRTLSGEEAIPIRVRPVAFGGSAVDKVKHSNARNEMMWGLRELLRTGNNDADMVIATTGPEVERLCAQLSAMHFGYDSKGRPALESKEEMKKRGMPSPDEADAVALSQYRPKSSRFVGGRVE